MGCSDVTFNGMGPRLSGDAIDRSDRRSVLGLIARYNDGVVDVFDIPVYGCISTFLVAMSQISDTPAPGLLEPRNVVRTKGARRACLESRLEPSQTQRCPLNMAIS